MPLRTEDRQYRLMAPMAAVTEAGRKLIDTNYYIEGYAATFEQPYTLWGEYKEVISRDALAGADVSDIIMQYDHEGRVLARNRNRTLVVLADEHGLRIGADLSKGESARQLYEEITNGLVDRMSWAFTIAPDGDQFDEETKTWTITRIKKVYDVSAVSVPANDATEISARSRIDGVIETAKQELRARRARALGILAKL